MRLVFFFKALNAGERWITVHANGPDAKGQPILVQQQKDGSMKVIGGAGGKLNHLRFTGVKPQSDYKASIKARAEGRRAQQKAIRQRDKELGIHEAKKAVREQISTQQREQKRQYVRDVAAVMGWAPGDVDFDAAKVAHLPEHVADSLRHTHETEMLKRATEAVELNRSQLLSDADAQADAALGEVPLDTQDPDRLSVQDLDPVKPVSSGLGFSSDYKGRAENQGLTSGDLASEAETVKKPPTEGHRKAAIRRGETAKMVQENLAVFREEAPAGDQLAPRLVEAKQAIELLKLEKRRKLAEKSARDARKKLDESTVEPKAYVLDVDDTKIDKKVSEDVANDLRTIRTRAFLSEIGKTSANPAADLGAHIGVGAYNSVNALALAAGGASLVDRSVVDVLGVAGAAEVLARRLHSDLSPEEVQAVAAGMEDFHLHHYMGVSQEAMERAHELQQQAKEIELGAAETGDDLAALQEINRRRADAIGDAHRVLGQALGEMEANAALVFALKHGKSDKPFEVALGRLPVEGAIRQLRAIGLQRGDYSIETVAGNRVASIKPGGLDRLAAPVNRADLEQVRRNLDIISGKHDEDGWLPLGMSDRPDLDLDLKPGVAPRLAEPFQPGTDLTSAVRDYIGGRAADGDAPADIVADLQSSDFTRKVGSARVDEYLSVLGQMAPLRTEDGKMQPAEALRPAFERMADEFVAARYGADRSPLHRQSFPIDEASADALHRALAAEPAGVAAYKPIGEMTPQDQGALRDFFAEHIARESPELGKMRKDLAKLVDREPARQVQDMFGSQSTNPAWSEWRGHRDELSAKIDAASLTWPKYVGSMHGTTNAYAAVQDLIRSRISKGFVDSYNKVRPEAPLKLGRAVVRNNLNHLDAVDPDAREARMVKERELTDGLRERVQGRYANGSVRDKLDSAREQQAGFEAAQMGFFADDGDLAASPESPSPKPAPIVFDRSTLLTDQFKAAAGHNMAKWSDHVGDQVRQALASEATVTFRMPADKKDVQIVKVDRGKLVDAKGQAWGLMSVAMPAPGSHDRIEIQHPAPAPSGKTQPKLKPLAADERHTAGHEAERLIGSMIPRIGANFRAGQPVKLFRPAMSGPKNAPRQRAIKMLEANKRIALSFGVGTGKTAITLGGFTHLKEQGKATRGLFLVPSIVQGQFGGEALRFLQPGRYDWHAQPGASRDERIAAYKNPKHDFVVMTHQSFRDDMIHLGAQHAGISPDEMSARLDAMPRVERKAWMQGVMAKEGINFDYSAVDEGHNTLNRKGKTNSAMANVIDAASDNTPYYVNASGDPVKNDVSEAFSLLQKMDPERYTDEAGFIRKYGVDTASAKDALRREMARFQYPSKIDPDVVANRIEESVPVSPGQRDALDVVDRAASRARVARMTGKVDVDALRALSPSSFSGVPEEQHDDVARELQRNIGILKATAVRNVLDAHPESGKLDRVADLAKARAGKPGVVFAHSLNAVEQIKARLERDGHRVVTITGKDSSADKEAKRRAFNPDSGEATADILVASDAGAVGMNAQRGQWLAQFDCPQTAMTHAQRQGRINRTGQKNNIDLIDLVSDHPEEKKARARLSTKYALRELMTTPMEGLDDTGVAFFLRQRAIAQQQPGAA